MISYLEFDLLIAENLWQDYSQLHASNVSSKIVAISQAVRQNPTNFQQF